MENRRGKTYITCSNCSLYARTAVTKEKRASKAAIYYIQPCFNNKGNLLCTSAEPQQRSSGRSRPSSLQMDAECWRVTVSYSLNTLFSQSLGAEWGHFNKLCSPADVGEWDHSSGILKWILKRILFCSTLPISTLRNDREYVV